ncbi:hypothetical protein DFQ14_102360 [Halopolyspora algeriensis]|uniref:Uncharacterized protein n=1 Tax=Halopolyspora algeriensis TaxID=1500506 RepID=A0A368W254_9ACTN|nr:hypothetical protein DFQ14_102360 [Halopolyspora algeriensis]TQM55467.1 hypothetical protein FHU43_0235 [Halopolyspora algeriensis]
MDNVYYPSLGEGERRGTYGRGRHLAASLKAGHRAAPSGSRPALASARAPLWSRLGSIRDRRLPGLADDHKKPMPPSRRAAWSNGRRPTTAPPLRHCDEYGDSEVPLERPTLCPPPALAWPHAEKVPRRDAARQAHRHSARLVLSHASRAGRHSRRPRGDHRIGADGSRWSCVARSREAAEKPLSGSCSAAPKVPIRYIMSSNAVERPLLPHARIRPWR